MEKKQITFHLSVAAKDRLKEAARILDRTQSSIAEEAFKEWFEKHGLNGIYQLNMTADNAVLIRTGESTEIIEVTERNGVPPQEMADKYRKQLRATVRLVVQEGAEPCPKKQS